MDRHRLEADLRPALAAQRRSARRPPNRVPGHLDAVPTAAPVTNVPDADVHVAAEAQPAATEAEVLAASSEAGPAEQHRGDTGAGVSRVSPLTGVLRIASVIRSIAQRPGGSSGGPARQSST